MRRGILNPCFISPKESQKRKKKEKRHTCVQQTVVVTLTVLVTVKTNSKVRKATDFSQIGCLMFVVSLSKNGLFVNVESRMLYTVGFQLLAETQR